MQEFVEKAVSLAKCDYAEARIESTTGDNIILKNGDIIAIGTKISKGMCIRAINNGSLGISFTNDFSNAGIKSAVDRAVKLAKASQKIIKDKIKLSGEKPVKDRYSVKEKKRLADVSMQEKLEGRIDVDKSLISNKLNFMTRFFDFSSESREKYFANSEGCSVYSYVPRLSLFCLISVKSTAVEQRMEHFGNAGGWEFFDKWDLEKRLAEEAKILAKIPAAPTVKGKLDVVLSPELVGIASHESCGHPYEADRILGREMANAGGSFITRAMIGQRIGSDVVNLVDDPTVQNSYGFYRYD